MHLQGKMAPNQVHVRVAVYPALKPRGVDLAEGALQVGVFIDRPARFRVAVEAVDYPGTIDIPGLRFEHRRKSMSIQRFTPEFKAEAVRQVIERGYSVAEIAAGFGVSTHSLYKWVKAVTPDKSEKQASELLEAKSEILRLRAQMRRLEEERDILKKPSGSSHTAWRP